MLSHSSLGPLGKHAVSFSHSRRFVEALDCSVNLLDHWSWFVSEGSRRTGELTLFKTKLRNAKQNCKVNKNGDNGRVCL